MAALSKTRLRGIPTCHGQDKRKVKPEFSTLHRPGLQQTTCGGLCGEPSRREKSGKAKRPRHNYSPSCTGVGVEKLGRGESTVRVVTPEADRYPSLAAVFRRRALFFEQPPAPNQSAIDYSGRFVIRRLDSRSNPGPYIS